MTSRYALSRAAGFAALLVCSIFIYPQPAAAQYLGHNSHGDFGVNSGTQPGPGLYAAVPFFQWNMDEIVDADGDRVATGFEGVDMRLLPFTFVVVSPKKILGANYGFMVALSASKVRPEQPAASSDSDASWGFTDTYIVPLYLGWHTPRADVVAGYGFFAPTGRYEARADDNVGLGMWSQELQLGTTVYFDAAKRFSAATTSYWEFHSKKKDLDIKVGEILTLEGGLAYNVPAIGGAFGVGYYLQQKLTDDSGSDIPELLLRALNLRGKNGSFGIGPDVTMGLFQRGQNAGLVNIRYLWESGAKSTFQGSTFWVSFTLARLAG